KSKRTSSRSSPELMAPLCVTSTDREGDLARLDRAGRDWPSLPPLLHGLTVLNQAVPSGRLTPHSLLSSPKVRRTPSSYIPAGRNRRKRATDFACFPIK